MNKHNNTFCSNTKKDVRSDSSDNQDNQNCFQEINERSFFFKSPSRCDFCIDPPKSSCNEKCKEERCKNFLTCHRVLKSIIRITTKCTQLCSHCAFEASPIENKFMKIKDAQDINLFCLNNGIFVISIMGGEFFCHPLWSQIIQILSNKMKFVRLVSNGDWASNKKITEQLINIMYKHPNIKISLSFDKWHTNQFINTAISICEKKDLNFDIECKSEGVENTIVPVGRAKYKSHFFSGVAKYCSSHRYTILIDERGTISYCPFGLWRYDCIQNFLNGGFSKRFKFVGETFRDAEIYSCNNCIRLFNKLGEEFEKDLDSC